jgi:hypothetical protein
VKAAMLGQKGEFQEGHQLDAKTARKIPKKMIGRSLSQREAGGIAQTDCLVMPVERKNAVPIPGGIEEPRKFALWGKHWKLSHHHITMELIESQQHRFTSGPDLSRSRDQRHAARHHVEQR